MLPRYSENNRFLLDSRLARKYKYECITRTIQSEKIRCKFLSSFIYQIIAMRTTSCGMYSIVGYLGFGISTDFRAFVQGS